MQILIQKKRVGETFRAIFKNNKHWELQSHTENSEPVYWLNTILFKNTEKNKIRELGTYLMSKGIEVRSGFWPLSDMAGFNSESFGLQTNGHNIFDYL